MIWIPVIDCTNLSQGESWTVFFFITFRLCFGLFDFFWVIERWGIISFFVKNVVIAGGQSYLRSILPLHTFVMLSFVKFVVILIVILHSHIHFLTIRTQIINSNYFFFFNFHLSTILFWFFIWLVLPTLNQLRGVDKQRTNLRHHIIFINIRKSPTSLTRGASINYVNP